MTETLIETRPTRGTMVFLPGSWERIPDPEDPEPEPSNWDELSRHLGGLGYEALVVSSLPTQDSKATTDDHIQAAANEIQSRATSPIRLFAGYSAGARLLRGVRRQLVNDGIITGDEPEALISGSLGNPDPSTLDDPLRAAIPEHRNTEVFRDSIEWLPDGRTIMGREAARRLLFRRVRRDFADRALDNMEEQFRVDYPPLPEPSEHETAYIYDPGDPIRIGKWVTALANANKFKIIKIRWAGHAIHVSRPKKLAKVLDRLAEQANKEAPRPKLILPQQRRESLIADVSPS